MCGDLSRVALALVAEREQIEPAEQMLAAPEDLRGDGEVHFVDQARLEVLADGGDAAAEVRVATNQPCNSSPPTPSGVSTL